jgi:16S rRNA (cytidine1402-2'-O)-methyltransferase
MSGTLFVVATPIGNLEDITLRALRVLREVTLVAAEDTRRTAHLLARYDIPTPTISLRKHNESQKAGALIDRLLEGQDIALVSDAGTPTLSDPGQWLVRSAILANVKVESVPGPSSVLAVLSASGFVSDTFLFLGFPPIRSKDRTIWMERIANTQDIVIFFEAPHRIRETLEQLQVLLGDRTVVVGRELTKIHEELVRGPISAVLARLQTPRGEFAVAVDIGHKTETNQVRLLADLDAYVEFSRLTSTGGLPRRRAINAIARKHQMAPNLVYAAIERGKILGKQQNRA